MKPLLRYFLVVFGLALGITALCSWLLKRGLRKSRVDFYGKMNAGRDSAANALFIGSSRMLTQVNPRIFDSVTGLNSYNYGLNAAGIKTCSNLLRYAAQKQHDIKAIVLNVDFFMFDTKADPYKDAYCYPYEKEITGLITNDTGSRYWLHRLGLFDISLCDDAIKYAALDGYSHLARTPAGIYKGFLPHNEPVMFSAPDMATVKPAPAAYSQQGFEILQQLLSDCQGKQWPLVLVIAPYYEQFFSARYVTNYDSIMNHVKQLAAASKIPVLDYSRIPLCSDTGMFFNVNHLNEKGAAIYTLQLARDISKILTK